MTRLFELANQYVNESDWKILALIKFCLCAVGVMIGMCLPKKWKKPVLIIASAIFTITYIPLMIKFLNIAKHNFLELDY